MRNITSSLVALTALLSPVLAHRNFESLIVNGLDTAPYEYVQRSKNSNGPIQDVKSSDMIRNRGGMDDDVMAATKTGATRSASASATSGAPGIQEWAPFVNNVGITNFTFSLPADLPPGQYLMRAEGIALHSAGEFGGAQFYIGCAQLEVTGRGKGSLGPLVKFPGAYKGCEPGILVGLWWPPLRNYTAPGPAVWPGNCEDHSPNYIGKPSDGDCTPLASNARG